MNFDRAGAAVAGQGLGFAAVAGWWWRKRLKPKLPLKWSTGGQSCGLARGLIFENPFFDKAYSQNALSSA